MDDAIETMAINEIRIYNIRSFDTTGYRNRISVNVIELNKKKAKQTNKKLIIVILKFMEQSVCILFKSYDDYSLRRDPKTGKKCLTSYEFF